MNIIFSILLTVTASSLLLFFIVFLYLLLRIFTGKSITSPDYPPVNGTVFNQLLYFNRLYDYQTQVAKKQPTYRLLGPIQSEIYTADVRNVEHVLKSTFDKYCKGVYNLDVSRDLLGEGIFAVDGSKWKQQRKLASFEFSTRVLRDYSCSVFRSNSAKLVKTIMEFAVAGRDFDLQDILMRFTLTSIFKVGFGMELDGSSKDGLEFMKAFDDSNALVYWRYVDPFWKLKRFLNVGCEATLKKKIKVLDDFLYIIITQKRKLLAIQKDEPSMVKEDILSRFLVESEKNPGVINDKYLRDIILNFMFAGKDTSAGTLSWFFYLLCKHPLVQEKIAEEVRSIGGDERDDEIDVDDFVGSINDKVLERMHYLHAALTETLRLYPAVPVDGRCAMVNDVLPNGYKVQKGDGVYYMAYAMGRMPYIWGEDAEEFRPERWLRNGTFQPDSPFKFVAFHAGPQICLGKDFAYRQMKIVAIALLRFFRFKLADENKSVTYKTMFTLHIAGGLNLCAFSRIKA